MALLKVVFYPDPCLRAPTELVKDITPEIKTLVSDMYETMYHEHGVGLAAPQVGISKRISVIDVSDDKSQPYCLINPELIEQDGEVKLHEGCLSLPGAYHVVKRARWVKMRALDIDGKSYELEGTGVLAEAIQHEIEHLNGILYLDQLSQFKQRRLIDKMQKHLRLKRKAQRG